MLKNKKHSKNFSKPIVIISIIGISLGVSVMVLTLSIATGFQNEIEKKLINFDSHIQIESIYKSSENETTPFNSLGITMDSILKIQEIDKIQKYAYKTTILQPKSTKNENKEIEGVIFKGISNNSNFGFFNQYLIEGKCPSFSSNSNDTIILSKSTTKKLNLKVDDHLRAFFISKNKPKQRNLVLGGIYKTGLDKLDDKIGFISLSKIIEINKWGTTINIKLKDSPDSTEKIISCLNKSKSSVFLYSWGNNKISKKDSISISTKKDTLIKLVAFEVDNYQNKNLLTIPDTLQIEYDSEKEKFNFQNSIGSGQHYTGGYEIKLKNYDNCLSVANKLKNIFGPQYTISSVEEKHEEMFSWLNLIYKNVYIIIVLMVAVAIVNMSSALLVLIVEKTKMIGILKAIGIKNKSVRRIFVIHGGLLTSIGFLVGNLLAIVIIICQNHYGFLKLPQQNYYLDKVPMDIPYLNIVLMNIITFIACYISMILPSIISTIISPVKAISSEI